MTNTKMDKSEVKPVKRRGRGFELNEAASKERHDSFFDEAFGDVRPVKSVEGWIVFVTNVHQEATEEDLYNVFGEFGDIKAVNLNIDRKTGYIKGYALVEFSEYEAAKRAILEGDGQDVLGQAIGVCWTFVSADSGSLNNSDSKKAKH